MFCSFWLNHPLIDGLHNSRH